MALQKEIELDNGIEVKYHRVVSVNNITNFSTNIEVASYISKKQREIEEEYQRIQLKNAEGEELTPEEKEILEKGINVFIYSDFIEMEYNKDMDVVKAYDYLKITDKYKDSKDV